MHLRRQHPATIGISILQCEFHKAEIWVIGMKTRLASSINNKHLKESGQVLLGQQVLQLRAKLG